MLEILLLMLDLTLQSIFLSSTILSVISCLACHKLQICLSWKHQISLATTFSTQDRYYEQILSGSYDKKWVNKLHRNSYDDADGHCNYASNNYQLHCAIHILLVSILTVEKGDGTLDKEATSHNDLMDAFRLSLQFWHWSLFNDIVWYCLPGMILYCCFLIAVLVIVTLFYKVCEVCSIHYTVTVNTLPFRAFLLLLLLLHNKLIISL